MDTVEPTPSPDGRAAASLMFRGLGLTVFLVFHFVPDLGGPGWRIWQNIGQLFEQPARLTQTGSLIIAAFLALAVTSIAAPFSGGVFCRSSLARYGLATLSLLATLVFGYWIIRFPMLHLFLLALAAALTTLGIFLVRPMTLPVSHP